MANRRWSGLKAQGGDVINLVVSYLKQETVGPLKDLGRYTAYGTLGSVFIGGGLVLDSQLRGGLTGNAGAVGSLPLGLAKPRGGTAPSSPSWASWP